LVHILTGKNIRMLHSSTREVRITAIASSDHMTRVADNPQILYAYEDENGVDVIASLDFWGRPQSPPQDRRSHHDDIEKFGGRL